MKARFSADFPRLFTFYYCDAAKMWQIMPLPFSRSGMSAGFSARRPAEMRRVDASGPLSGSRPKPAIVMVMRPNGAVNEFTT